MMEVTRALLSQTQPATVTSVVPVTDRVHNVVYVFELPPPHRRASFKALVTHQMTVHAPVGRSHIKRAFVLSFTLPEAAEAGTVNLLMNSLASLDVVLIMKDIVLYNLVYILMFFYFSWQHPTPELSIHHLPITSQHFPGNRWAKYVWHGCSHFNNVCSDDACAPVVACGRCDAPPTS
jgi:hypothetical protein